MTGLLSSSFIQLFPLGFDDRPTEMQLACIVRTMGIRVRLDHRILFSRRNFHFGCSVWLPKIQSLALTRQVTLLNTRTELNNLFFGTLRPGDLDEVIE